MCVEKCITKNRKSIVFATFFPLFNCKFCCNFEAYVFELFLVLINEKLVMENWQSHHSKQHVWILFITKNMDNSAWNFNAIWYEFWVRSTIILKTVKKSKKNLFLIFIWHSLESVPRKIIDFEEGHDISKSESKLYTYIYIKSSSSVMRIEEEERERKGIDFIKKTVASSILKKYSTS